MPFHKIGERAKAIEPTEAKLDHLRGELSYKVNSAESVSNEVINSWFNDAFLALRDDPYIHMKMDSPEHRRNLFVFSKNGESLMEFGKGGNTIEELPMDDKRALFEASQEGQLFYYDPSLGKFGGMRQLYTKTNDLKLCVTEEINELPARVEEAPTAPTWWTYVKSFFRVQSARAEIQAYNEQLAKYNHSEAQCKAFSKLNAEKIAEGKRPDSPCKAARAERNQRIKEYEESLPKKHVANPVPVKPKAPVDRRLPYEIKQPQRGLKVHMKEGLENCFKRMTFKADAVPQNKLGLDGLKFGALVSMAMGSPDISIKHRDNSIEANDPEINYDKIVGGKYFKGLPLNTRFLASAHAATVEALTVADNGDFSKLGKLIAEGLIQNNRVLKAHKELTDIFSGYARLGGIVLDIMQENPQLGNAVIDYLGEDAEKQLNMASAARNISELRADAMEAYQRMIKDFHVMSDVKTYDKNNNLVMKKRPATTYSIQDVTRVALLSDIEVDMNSGKFDLENSKFADPDTIKNIIDDYAHSQVLDKFLWDTNRGDVLKDPVQMKVLFAAATDDEKMQEYLKLKQLAREQGLDNAETYMAEVNAFGVEKDEYDPNFDVHDFLDIPKLRQQSFGDDVLDQDALDESFDVHEYLNIPKGP